MVSVRESSVVDYLLASRVCYDLGGRVGTDSLTRFLLLGPADRVLVEG